MTTRGNVSEPHTPISLILRLGQNDDGDWRLFFDIYGPVIYRLAKRWNLTHHDAQDVVAIVMRSIHRAVGRGFQLDPDKGRFRGYLARTVQRAVRDLKRKGGKSPVTALALRMSADKADAAILNLTKIERIERLRYCLDRLRKSSKVRRRDVEAFERFALQEEPAGSVAAFCGISNSRLYGIKTEMIDRIRRMMTELDIELGEV